MRLLLFTLPLALLLCTSATASAQAKDDALKIRPERTNYEETSNYDDVIRFLAELQKRSDLVQVETIGQTQEGRAIPVMILADPPITTPRQALGSGKPIVFIMANIHAGEVEGKEAVMLLSRRLFFGDLRPLLGKIVILMAPIYNADGNEKFNLQNRTAQNGPIAGVGIRENAKGLDLNRDYMKMEAPETQALIRLFNRWDPHVTVNLHTTNGSYHGYHLTYSIPLNPSFDTRLLAYHRDTMMPALAKTMLEQHKFRTYYYGNFSGSARAPGQPDTRVWQAFTHEPRIGQNYVGLRNRLTILSEAYSYITFKRRVEVTEAFVEDIFQYSAAHGAEIIQLTRRADEDTIQLGRTGKGFQLGVAYERKALPEPVDILLGEVTKLRNPRNGRDMTAMVEDKFTTIKIKDFGLFAATRSVSVPRAYLFRAEAGTRIVLEKLLAHGVAVEELTAPLKEEVESFTIKTIKWNNRAFQGHREVKLTGEFKKEIVEYSSGTYLVRTAQPLGRLAAYLLEPESDDGLADWNFLDSKLELGKVYPIQKLTSDVKVSSRLVEQKERR